MVLRRSGDGFLTCSDGRTRWGRFGAAGVVFVLRNPSMAPLVMLQKRSAWAHEGGTWSCAGGAIDEGETAYEAALREAGEEVGANCCTIALLPMPCSSSPLSRMFP